MCHYKYFYILFYQNIGVHYSENTENGNFFQIFPLRHRYANDTKHFIQLTFPYNNILTE